VGSRHRAAQLGARGDDWLLEELIRCLGGGS